MLAGKTAELVLELLAFSKHHLELDKRRKMVHRAISNLFGFSKFYFFSKLHLFFDDFKEIPFLPFYANFALSVCSMLFSMLCTWSCTYLGNFIDWICKTAYQTDTQKSLGNCFALYFGGK